MAHAATHLPTSLPPTLLPGADLPCFAAAPPRPHSHPTQGTAQSAELVDLLFAHHAPVEAATALLSMRQLLVRPEGDVGVAAFQVLSAVLDSGRQLELVVAAPTVSGATPGTAPAPLLAAPAEFIRIVISDQGVHEVRAGVGASTEGPSARRLLTVSSGLGGIQGIVHDVIIGACSEPVLPFCLSFSAGCSLAFMYCLECGQYVHCPLRVWQNRGLDAATRAPGGSQLCLPACLPLPPLPQPPAPPAVTTPPT